MHFYAARQPILDRNKKLFAYELLFRDGLENVFPDIDENEATSKIIEDNLVGISDMTDDTPAFINFTLQTLQKNYATMLDKEQVVIEILETVQPGKRLLAIVKELKQYQPEIPILVLSMYPEDQFAIRVIKSGASGYLSKNSALAELTKAMKNLLDGKKYITESVADVLVSDLRKNHELSTHSSLSDREFEVLCSLGLGKTVSQIAIELSLSVKTISTHRSKILKKMDMKTNAELIRYALAHKLIS